ncbi:Zinc finger PMZ-type [Arabidopsis suecica]|uniref:Zinc finger PMZ-type n=1 Tax=Arabidopsis suecica TaxID=45249 RepID=A0A8T2BD21_ARASU|nr:Zinc finger PMZ-type [Arabidopsis suecica]
MDEIQPDIDMEDVDNNGSEENEDDNKKQKNKKEGKKKKNESKAEDEEDGMDRFEFEVEDSVGNFVDEFSVGRNEIPDSSDEDEDPIVLRDRRIRRSRVDRLSIGQLFFNGVEFKEAIIEYALNTGNNVVQGRWEKTKLEFKCGIVGKCKWRVYCSYDEPRQMWVVKTTYRKHSCTPNGRCKILRSPVIARLFMDKLRVNPKFMPKEIQNHIKDHWKIVSSRGQCQSARLLALKLLEKEYEEQFTHIRGYVEEILSTNPGSTAIVETIPNSAGEDVFNRFYVCFEIIRTLWRGSCRPIIGLDGTFLKTAVKGVLLAAVGHDANNQIYPLAWAVGLISSVQKELPKAEHRFCVKHIIENLKNKHPKKDLIKPLIWQLAWSYNKTEFKENLNNVKEYSIDVYNLVMKKQPEMWSRAFFKLGSNCEDVDNNATESFNASITKARAKAMIPMLDTIRRQAMHRMVKRHNKSKNHEGMFTEYVAKILAKEKKDASKCETTPATHGVYEVMLYGNDYSVNTKKRTCTCGKWQISGIPCEHAYGAMIDYDMNVESYVSGFFSTDLWRDNYEQSIHPMRGPRFWMTSTYRLVTAPPEPILPGKKKTNRQKTYPRIKGKHESPQKKTIKETLGRKGRIVRCSSCRETGHNAAGCKQYPKEKSKRQRTTEVVSSSSQVPDTISLTQPSQTTPTW